MLKKLIIIGSVVVTSSLLTWCSPISAKDDCNAMQIQVLGSGGPEINDGLASSSYLIWINGKSQIMVDAGGGSSLNFEKSGANFNNLAAILLTHFHVDHSAAIPVYIKASYFTGRDTNLPILGPAAGGNFPSAEDFIDALFGSQASRQNSSAYPYLSDTLSQKDSTDYLIKPLSVNPKGKIWHQSFTDKLAVAAIDVQHGAIPALAWRVNYGTCSVTFSGDMNGSTGHLQQLALHSQLLVANNAIPEGANQTAKWLHMEPSMIGKIAFEAKVGKLMLSHFMLRTKDVVDDSKAEIKKNYQGEIIVAKDLLKIPIE